MVNRLMAQLVSSAYDRWSPPPYPRPSKPYSHMDGCNHLHPPKGIALVQALVSSTLVRSHGPTNRS